MKRIAANAIRVSDQRSVVVPFLDRSNRQEVFSDPFRIFLHEFLEPFLIAGTEYKPYVLRLVHTVDDLGSIVMRGVGFIDLGKCKGDSGKILS